MKRTKPIIKHIVQCALKSEFGFAPSLSAITLYESSMAGTFVLFEVGGKKYRFESEELTMGGMKSVYVGPGTISRW